MGQAIYRPARVDQLDGSKFGPANCNMSAAAVAADRQTLGIHRFTGAQMRSCSGDHLGGTDMGGAATALHVCANLTLNAVEKGNTVTLMAALARHAVITFGDYRQVPASLSGDLEFHGTHSVVGNEYSKSRDAVLVYDGLDDGRHDLPTGHVAPTGPIWWPREVFLRYASHFPDGVTYGMIEPWRAFAKVPVANVRVAPTRARAVIYRLLAGSSHSLVTGGAVAGERISGDNRWFRVWVPSLGKIGYVHASVATKV